MRILSIGHVLFALTFVFVGVLCFITGGFTSIYQGVPRAWPDREILAYVCGAVSLACGAGLLFKTTGAWAARILFAFLLLWMLAFKVPFIFKAPLEEGSYQSNGENAVWVAAAWVLYIWLASDGEKQRLGLFAGARAIRRAHVLFALALIAFGFSHFAYENLTTPLVPAYLPWHGSWAYITGGAYLAAGLAILFDIIPRLAAALATAQMAGFLLLIWIPLLASGHADEFRFGEFVATCVLVAAAWVVTDSYRDEAWLMPKRAQT
ncbi:MAG TPA: hypothetical protein VHC73_02410 [Vitreimonas sp.]|jgi:uncharacterized membrane protein|nr:hypothetical protein [Vitreimonas sp.]